MTKEANNMTAIFFYIAVLILIVAVILAIRKRKEAGKWITCLTTGAVLAMFFMVLPTRWTQDGAQIWSSPLYTFASSLFYSLKTLGGGQSLDQLESSPFTGFLKHLYMALSYFLIIATPLLTSSLILSFIGDCLDRIRYFFTFAPKCYVFSEVNENTLAIAAGVRKTSGRKAIVFCNGKGTDKALARRVRELHGILLYAPCSILKLRPARQIKQYEFNLLSDREDRNIELAEALIARSEQFENRDLTVNAFVHSATESALLENMLSEHDAGNTMKLRFIDEISLFCNNLLYRHPLFELPDGRKDISVLIVGCGTLGKEMLKTALWNGQIEGYPLKIRVVDKHACRVRAQFLAQCPQLDQYDIEFLSADVERPTFEEAVNACADATFICVATGSDELNIATAETVYQIFRRRDPRATPPIYTRVRNATKTKNLVRNKSYLTERNIRIFGTVESIFSECTLFHSELEKLAFAVHLCYNGQPEENTVAYERACRSFYSCAYNCRSSMAAALHIPVKLYQCGIRLNLPLADISEAQLQQIEAAVQEEAIREKLARNEHARWNAFMRSEGYRTADIDAMRRYAPVTHRHDDKKGRLHPCIVSWEELDAVQAEYDILRDRLGLRENKFKENDYLIVSQIPQILRKAKNL